MPTPRIATLLALMFVVPVSFARDAPDPSDPKAVSDEERARVVIDALTDPDAYVRLNNGLLPSQGAAMYQLLMLGDSATATLLEVLDCELPAARRAALRLLGVLGLKDALESIEAVMKAEHDPYTRGVALSAMLGLAPEYTAEVVFASLDSRSRDFVGRCSILAKMGDTRVIPHLRPLLEGEVYTRRTAAELLATFGDAEAATVLLEAYRSLGVDTEQDRRARESAFRALVGSGDERAIPLIVALFDGSSRHPEEGDSPVRAPKDAYRYGSAIVPPMLEAITPGDVVNVGSIAQFLRDLHWGQRPEGPPNTAPSPDHVDDYARALMDPRYAIEPYRSYNVDSRLRSTLAEAVASLGEEGKERLRRAVHTATAHREALKALASYSDEATAHELGSLATDVSYPYREPAIAQFADMAWLHEDAAEPYWLTLLADETIDAAPACIRHISLGRPAKTGALLARLLQSDDPAIRERARGAHSRYVDAAPADWQEGLRIRVATDRQAYGYDEDITLTVEFINAGERPMQMNTTVFDRPLYGLDAFNLELVTPDGDVRAYPADSGHGSHGVAPTEGQPRTLQPGDVVSTQRNLRTRCRRPGTYRAQVSRGHLPGSSGWRYASPRPAPLLTSNVAEFRLDAPSRAFVDDLVARLHPGLLTNDSHKSMRGICGTLGALRDPRAIDALRALALVPLHPFAVRNMQAISGHAQKALAEFHTTDLVPMWIELLDRPHANAASQLGELGDRRAIVPLRMRAFRFPLAGAYDMEAVAALSQLGDNDAIHAVRRDILTKIDPKDEATWFRAVEVFSLNLPGEQTMDLLSHERPGVRAAAVYIATREGYVDVLA
ncbi:HEAT repeat domain-containing protein, partial [Candidatus Poribacteria bacterium]|nr:HEAT repeat domain-containing protein [Candidatus Poribacteria bacterium]